MSFDVTAMDTYVKNENRFILDTILFNPDIFRLVSVENGIKTSLDLPDMLGGDITLQTGDYTGADNYAGGVVYTEKKISVNSVWFKEKYKKYELEKTLLNLGYKAGSNPDETAYNDMIMKLKGSKLAVKNATLVMQGGDVTNVDTTTEHIDGFVEIILAADAAKVAGKRPVGTGADAVAWTRANALAKMTAFIDKFVANFTEMASEQTEQVLFMSYANYYAYRDALVGQVGTKMDDLSIVINDVSGIKVPGYDFITVMPQVGLQGSNEKFLTRRENMVIGVDTESETANFEFPYLDAPYRYFEMFGLYKLGTMIFRPQEVIFEGIEAV